MSLEVHEFRARRYRSLQAIAYPMSGLDVFVGANGAGKTNLYRGLELLRAAAANTLARDLVEEGGFASAIWAGPRRRNEAARIELAVGFVEPGARAARYRYDVAVGLPPREASASFGTEPDIKEESLALVTGQRTVRLMERKGPSVMARGLDGRPAAVDIDLLDSETVLRRLEDPTLYPGLDAVRRTLLQWRFYHGLRTDAGSPLRRPGPAVPAPTLASDGADLAAVFATLVHIRQDTVDLDHAIDRAFPGARLVVPMPEQTASFGMSFPDFPKRVFEAHELSDGTLRFLALAGALLAYRLPPFVALNEPEASLHPDLLEPLAELVVRASERAQIWLVTHSTRLADAVAASGAGAVRTVLKRDGATEIEGLKRWGAFADDEED
jgi:predicted ATPase